MSESAENIVEPKVEVTTEEAAAQPTDQTTLEVVVSEDETPSSVMPVSSHIAQKAKWKERQKQAESAASAKDQENELLRLQLQQLQDAGSKKTVPVIDDFDTPEEYSKALTDFLGRQREEDRKQIAAEILTETQKSQTQRKIESGREEALDKHYERAQKLNASDFSDAEDRVLEAIGKDAAIQIIQSFDHSEAVMYALGNNPARLSRVAELLKSNNPVKAVVELTEFAGKVSLKPKTQTPPEPDDDAPQVSSGSADLQGQLNALRKRRDEGKASVRDCIDFKRQAAAQGVYLN